MRTNPSRRLRSVDSPSKPVSLKWVPKGMDPTSACRVAIRVPAYVEQRADGKDDYHVTSDLSKVLDKDTCCWIDFLQMLEDEIVHGEDQEFVVTYWDKNSKKYVELASDFALLEALEMYWEIRRLPVTVEVKDTGPRLASTSDPTVDQSSTVSSQVQVHPVLATQHSNVEHGPGGTETSNANPSKSNDPNTAGGTDPRDEWGEFDDVEYVEVDDEIDKYRDLVMSDGEAEDPEYCPGSDEDEVDKVGVDDNGGCEEVTHITNLENPKIVEGVTFEHGHCFNRCIRQYAVINKIELVVPYCESRRYRAFCKGKRCKWRIHASQLPDGRTWMIKKLPHKHTCDSTSKLVHNCMATNHWFKDRVIHKLREDSTIGAQALRQLLQEKYCIKISYWVAWDGRQMALNEILGSWEESFEPVFNWKAEIKRRSPRSIVEVDWSVIEDKHRFSRIFVALKPCIDGSLLGCRPYLGIDSTALTGKWRGQLASAIAIDGHNWMFPVAYGVFDTESRQNWQWFMEKLHKAIGSPHGLVLSTDAGKGIDAAVTNIFTNGVKHRECMQHLVKNFQKRFRGQILQRNLWPAARAYRRETFDKHIGIMENACPRAVKWLMDNHKHLWDKSKFSTNSKCDYVTNNIAETFNNWVRHEKSLPVVMLMDKIRHMIMERFCTRVRVAQKLRGKILPHIIKELNEKSRNLQYTIHRSLPHIGEVGGVGKDLIAWRHTVDVIKRECSCRKWQLTGLPCTHAIAFIGTRRVELEDYVDHYYSIEMFKAAYSSWICPMPDKSQWEKVDMGFKMWPPILERAARQPRIRRIVGVEEGGSGSRRWQHCKRCGGYGHLQKTCNEPVLDGDAPVIIPSRKRRKGSAKATAGTTTDVDASTSHSQTHRSQGAIVPLALTSSPGPITRRQKALLEGSSSCLG